MTIEYSGDHTDVSAIDPSHAVYYQDVIAILIHSKQRLWFYYDDGSFSSDVGVASLKCNESGYWNDAYFINCTGKSTRPQTFSPNLLADLSPPH